MSNQRMLLELPRPGTLDSLRAATLECVAHQWQRIDDGPRAHKCGRCGVICDLVEYEQVAEGVWAPVTQ